MQADVLTRLFFTAGLYLLSLQGIAPAGAQSGGFQLTPAQTLQPADLTPKELNYFKTLSDPQAAKGFIETRSYMRLARRVVAKEMPAIELPNKPAGFNRAYLLRGEEAVIEEAIKLSLVELMKKKLAPTR